jgi:hypothetical protein
LDVDLAATGSNAAARAPVEQKRWQAEEEAELQHLAEDAQYRLQCLGKSNLDWPAIGRLVGAGAVAARDKYWRMRLKKTSGAL